MFLAEASSATLNLQILPGRSNRVSGAHWKEDFGKREVSQKSLPNIHSSCLQCTREEPGEESDFLPIVVSVLWEARPCQVQQTQRQRKRQRQIQRKRQRTKTKTKTKHRVVPGAKKDKDREKDKVKSRSCQELERRQHRQVLRQHLQIDQWQVRWSIFGSNKFVQQNVLTNCRAVKKVTILFLLERRYLGFVKLQLIVCMRALRWLIWQKGPVGRERSQFCQN